MTSYNKKVSIVVPVYNVKDYVGKCIDSILNQSYENLEIIIVDDGSTDDSGIICDRYKQSDDRIQVFHKKNGGLSSARNVGIEMATGTYIAFIDSDDFIHRDMIKTLITDIEEKQVDIACCNYNFCDEKDVLIRTHFVNIQGTKVMDTKEAVEKLLYEAYFKCYAWNKLYLRALFKDVIYPEGKLYEDITTTYRLFKKCNLVSFNDKSLYSYRVRQNSITKKGFDNKSYDLLEAVRYIWNQENNSEVMVGCSLYLLYFIDDMIRADFWNQEVYLQYRDWIFKVKKYLVKTKNLSLMRKFQMFFCAFNSYIYRKIYYLSVKIRR